MTERRFYVYALFDWRGMPFYIGMGSGRRLSKTIKDGSPSKIEMVAETKAIIGEVPIAIIREELNRDEAYQLEMSMISCIGMRPNGPLVNSSETGLDTTAAVAAAALLSRGSRLSEEHKRKLSQAKAGVPKSEKHKESMSLSSASAWNDPIKRANRVAGIRIAMLKRRKISS